MGQRMVNPYCFTNRVLQVEFNISLDSHYSNHIISTVAIKPNYAESETRYGKILLRELAVFNAILLNKDKFKYQTVFSARIDKHDEDGQTLDGSEF